MWRARRGFHRRVRAARHLEKSGRHAGRSAGSRHGAPPARPSTDLISTRQLQKSRPKSGLFCVRYPLRGLVEIRRAAASQLRPGEVALAALALPKIFVPWKLKIKRGASLSAVTSPSILCVRQRVTFVDGRLRRVRALNGTLSALRHIVCSTSHGARHDVPLQCHPHVGRWGCEP
jgi:hypothetical protein